MCIENENLMRKLSMSDFDKTMEHWKTKVENWDRNNPDKLGQFMYYAVDRNGMYKGAMIRLSVDPQVWLHTMWRELEGYSENGEQFEVEVENTDWLDEFWKDEFEGTI